MKYFYIEYGNGRCITVQTHDAGTADLVWDSQKSFFSPGSMVAIRDQEGNRKTYVKELNDIYAVPLQ